MMSNKKSATVKEMVEKGKYQSDEYIDPSDLGVYYFNYASKRNKQVVVQKVNVEDSGFTIASIDKTIQEQNTIAEELYYGIKYGN